MRKATGISPKYRENINYRTKPERHPSGSKQAKKGNTEVRESGNDFLTSIFKPIRAIDIDPLYSEVNYKYLYDSAKNYTGLLNKGFNIEYNPTAFNSLYTEFEKKVPEGQSLYIFERDNMLHFKITQTYDNNILYYIPCEIIDKSSGVFRDILIDFFCILKYTQKLTSQMDSYHCSGLLEELEYQEESGEQILDNDYLELLKSYKDGDIANTLDLVNSHPKYAPLELQKIISEYKPQSDKESEILVLLIEGLEILKYETSIFQYAEVPNSYDPNGYTEVPMSADELVMIVYSDDIIVENMIESVNISCQECEPEYFCAGKIELEPDTEQAMQPEWFVVNFLEWLSKFISKLYDN